MPWHGMPNYVRERARWIWRGRRRPILDRYFALSLDPMFIVTLDGVFHRVNPAFVAWFGHPQPKTAMQNLIDLLHPDDRAAAAAAISTLSQGSRAPGLESRFLGTGGSYKWLAWSGTPFLKEGLIYVVAHDLTRQRWYQEALRQAESRCAWAIESTTDAIFAVDREWRIIRVNQQTERLWRRHRDELIGRNLWDVFPEAAGGPFYQFYERVMRTEIPGHMEEFYPYAPLDRWFEVHAYPRPDGLAVYFRDVTERRLADDKIRRTLLEKKFCCGKSTTG